jgi:hypothetical protein
MIKKLTKERFDLYILGTRNLGHAMYQEISYWSNQDETVVGFIAYDRTDQDYYYGILMRDGIGRLRFAEGEASFPKEKAARKAMKKRLRKLTNSPHSSSKFIQGDEPNNYIDLLNVPLKIPNDKLHPFFAQLTQNPGYSPGACVVKELSPWIRPKDRHLEKEFQTSQFDQRLWEIYLWAALKESLFDVEQLEAPDFLCKWMDDPLFTIEATTVAPSTTGVLAKIPNPPKDDNSFAEYNDGYMAIKFGSSLTSKLEKRYWEKPEARGLPLIIAIADFHRPDSDIPSMAYSQYALAPYLYGFKSLVTRDENGKYQIHSKSIDKHKYLGKEIPSSFFNLPDAEHISAVLFCNTGTIAKFTRMGVLAGFKPPNYQYIRTGVKYNVSDPIATDGIPHSVDVETEGYSENWSEELHLFHNPNAKHKLPENYFRHINQHWSMGSHIESKIHPTWIYSTTSILHFVDD